MHLVMFDIDGTLLESCDFDSECFRTAINDVLGVDVDPNWKRYRYVTDSGILDQLFQELAIEANWDDTTERVKAQFLARLSDCVTRQGINAVPGSAEFLVSLRERPDATVAIATGGWLESARLKLESAGFDLNGIIIASGSDHYDRAKIMETAERRTGRRNYKSKTYFGDQIWDREAALSLGYQFVAVGGAVEHPQSVQNFKDIPGALCAIGL